MPITTTDIVLYASQSMPTGDALLSGGAINSGVRVVFTDIVALDVIEASGGASDSGTLSVTGRNLGGSIVTETFALSGTTLVSGSQTFERILSVSMDAIATGTITLRDAATDTAVGSIPPTESGFRRPFYNATAEAAGGSDKELYEKIFLMNIHTGLSLLGTTVTEVVTGIYANVAFALENTLESTQSVADRTTVPTGTGPYGSGASGIPGTDLAALSHLGIWLQFDVNAGDAAQNSFYQLTINGSST